MLLTSSNFMMHWQKINIVSIVRIKANIVSDIESAVKFLEVCYLQKRWTGLKINKQNSRYFVANETQFIGRDKNYSK